MKTKLVRPTRECVLRELVHTIAKYEDAIELVKDLIEDGFGGPEATRTYEERLHGIQNNSFHFDPVKDTEGIEEVEWTEEEAREWALNNIG